MEGLQTGRRRHLQGTDRRYLYRPVWIGICQGRLQLYKARRIPAAGAGDEDGRHHDLRPDGQRRHGMEQRDYIRYRRRLPYRDRRGRRREQANGRGMQIAVRVHQRMEAQPGRCCKIRRTVNMKSVTY